MNSHEVTARERPSIRVTFRSLALFVAALVVVAVVAGRYIYHRYGGYRPLALAHVPQDMRYRARIELNDVERVRAIAPLLAALDPRGARLPALEKKLGTDVRHVVREVAFGIGTEPSDFVLVFGLQLQAETGLPPAQILCEVLGSDGIRSEPTEAGCRLSDGALVAKTAEGSVVVASRAELVKGLLGRPDIGDRLGFSGPSVRGVAPETVALASEAARLAQAVRSKYP